MAKNSWEKGDEEVGRWEMRKKSWEMGDEENFRSREIYLSQKLLSPINPELMCLLI